MRVSNVTVRKRLFFSLIVGLLVFLIIDIRLGYVQFFLGEMLTSEAEELWSRDIPFEAQRGEILDRNGIALATNISAPTVYVVPRQITDVKETASKLASVLGASEEEILSEITKKAVNVRIKSGRKIAHETAKEIRALNLKGVYIGEDSKRYYPFGDYLSHVLGFTGIDNQGLMGLELYYDKELSGTRGSVQFYANAKGERMSGMADDYQSPVDGYALGLTIDSRIQTIMERELDIAEATYNPDSIIAIAMNPNTGEILGMASSPSFEPSNYQAVASDVYNRNLPIWMSYEPGSTFKVITLAAAVEEGKVDLVNEHFYDKGSVTIAGARLKCWKAGGHGSQSYLEVVQNSCNPGFIELGNRLGKEKLFNYIDLFGFGKKTGIDLAGEATGIIFNIDRVGPVELATTAFGQGVSVTPIQQVAALSAAINGGILYKPYIVKELVDTANNQVVMRNTPVEKERPISEETSKIVREALETVVAQGSGGRAFVDGYRVGGKTGTAQKAVDGRYLEGNYIVSFIGFAPADNPQIVVYVAVDNPKGTVQFGGVVAAPIVGNIIEDSLHVLEVPRSENQVEKEIVWPDAPMVEVPNLIGATKLDIQEMMINLRIDSSGVGDVVIKQTPEAGVKLKEGSTIRLYFGASE